MLSKSIYIIKLHDRKITKKFFKFCLLACNIKILIEQAKKFCKLTCIINKIEVKIIIINRIIIIIGEKIAIIIYN